MAKAPKALGKVYDLSKNYGYVATIVGYNHSPKYEIKKVENNDGSVEYSGTASFGGGGMRTTRATLDEIVVIAKDYLSSVSNKDVNKTLWIL